MTTVNKYHVGVSAVVASVFLYGAINYHSKEMAKSMASIDYMILGAGILLFGNAGVEAVSEISKRMK